MFCLQTLQATSLSKRQQQHQKQDDDIDMRECDINVVVTTATTTRLMNDDKLDSARRAEMITKRRSKNIVDDEVKKFKTR